MGIFSETSPKMHFNDVVLAERTIIGSSGYAREMTFVLEMMADERIDLNILGRLITGKIELKDTVEKGFKELLENREAHLKLLVEPPNWH